jgi:hypothetical protein
MHFEHSALLVDDYDTAIDVFFEALEFVTEPQVEPYGTFAVFRDVAWNKWDLLGPDPRRRCCSPPITEVLMARIGTLCEKDGRRLGSPQLLAVRSTYACPS